MAGWTNCFGLPVVLASKRNALRSYDEHKDFKQLLLADTEVMGVLDRQTVEDAFDLKVQLKNVDQIFDRVFGSAAVAAGRAIHLRADS